MTVNLLNAPNESTLQVQEYNVMTTRAPVMQGLISCRVGSFREKRHFSRQKVTNFNVPRQNFVKLLECLLSLSWALFLAHSGALSGSLCLTLVLSGSLWISPWLTLTHSGSLWLTLTQSGSLWLSLWLSQALVGSQHPCWARYVVAAKLQFITPCYDDVLEQTTHHLS